MQERTYYEDEEQDQFQSLDTNEISNAQADQEAGYYGDSHVSDADAGYLGNDEDSNADAGFLGRDDASDADAGYLGNEDVAASEIGYFQNEDTTQDEYDAANVALNEDSDADAAIEAGDQLEADLDDGWGTALDDEAFDGDSDSDAADGWNHDMGASETEYAEQNAASFDAGVLNEEGGWNVGPFDEDGNTDAGIFNEEGGWNVGPFDEDGNMDLVEANDKDEGVWSAWGNSSTDTSSSSTSSSTSEASYSDEDEYANA